MTPIERAIAGEPSDRRRRYEHRLREKGIKRIALNVRTDHTEFFHQLAALSRVSDPEGWQVIMGEVSAFFDEVMSRLGND